MGVEVNHLVYLFQIVTSLKRQPGQGKIIPKGQKELDFF